MLELSSHDQIFYHDLKGPKHEKFRQNEAQKEAFSVAHLILLNPVQQPPLDS